jgi:hypothetical protein
MTKEAQAYKAYADEFTNTLMAYGAEKRATAEILEKVAQGSLSSDYSNLYSYLSPYANYAYSDQKSTLQKILPWGLALAGLIGLGTVAYKAGKEGDPAKAWYQNSLDYIKRVGNKFVRKTRSTPWTDFTPYMDNMKPSPYTVA